jgi:hypothetical protein
MAMCYGHGLTVDLHLEFNEPISSRQIHQARPFCVGRWMWSAVWQLVLWLTLLGKFFCFPNESRLLLFHLWNDCHLSPAISRIYVFHWLTVSIPCHWANKAMCCLWRQHHSIRVILSSIISQLSLSTIFSYPLLRYAINGHAGSISSLLLFS